MGLMKLQNISYCTLLHFSTLINVENKKLFFLLSVHYISDGVHSRWVSRGKIKFTSMAVNKIATIYSQNVELCKGYFLAQ